MLINFNKISNTIPILKIQFSFINFYIYLKSTILLNTFNIIKYHFKYQFKILTSIIGTDYLEKEIDLLLFMKYCQ